MTPDGTPKLMQVINGTYPGPVISASEFSIVLQGVLSADFQRLGGYSRSLC